MVFQVPVPLDTVSAEYIGADGVRRELSGFTHGALGDREVVVKLPRLESGPVQLRWRLVGPDGHPITGRIAFTIAGAAGANTEDPRDSGLPGRPESALNDESQSEVTTPEWARWAARFGAYVALMILVGVVATAGFTWPGSWDQPLVRHLMAAAIVVSASAAIVQLLIIAADIEGAGIGIGSFSELSAALSTDAGRAFASRVVLLAILAWIVFRLPTSPMLRWGAAAAVSVLALATWAHAGHARSMRMALIGVPLDVLHSAGAATWLGGLVLIGLVGRSVCRPDELRALYQRFSPLAGWSVGIIVATGLAQTLRLAGNPVNLFGNAHGRLLLAKALLLGLMLKVADINRKRILNRFKGERAVHNGLLLSVGRAMTTELAVGLGILALTAVLVVSPPATADEPSAVASAVPSPTSELSAPTSTTVLASCPTVSSGLRLGDTGAEVECLQRALRRFDPTLGVTGDFDEATEAAVRSLQAAEGLDQDGIVGPATAAVLAAP